MLPDPGMPLPERVVRQSLYLEALRRAMQTVDYARTQVPPHSKDEAELIAIRKQLHSLSARVT